MESIRDYIDSALDQAFAKTARPSLEQIAALSRNQGLPMQDALRRLDERTKQMQDDGERMTADNPELEQSLRVNRENLTVTQGLIQAGAITIEEAVVPIAIAAVTSKVLGKATSVLIANKINPISPAGIAAFTKIIQTQNAPWRVLSAKDIILRYVQTDAWRDKLTKWGAGYADLTEQTILVGVQKGWGPIRTAREVRKLAQNIPLSASENLMRTLQLHAYREAGLQMETVNGGFIQKKIRVAHLDQRTCFPAGTMIKTNVGDIPIESVKVGDCVITHTGKDKEVTEIMESTYIGKMATIKTGKHSIICTEDHPILINRGRHCYWESAKNIIPGDEVFVFDDNGTYNLNHISGDVSVKWGVRNTDDKESAFIKPSSFSSVGFLALRMPIDTVNLKGYIALWKKKINSITVNFGLLFKWFSNFIKAKTNVFFWFCFICALMITACAAILSSQLSRTNPELITTVLAYLYKWWPSTFFGTIMSFIPYGTIKLFTAPFTNNHLSLHVFLFAFKTAIAVSIAIRLWNTKIFTTSNTNLMGSGIFPFAFKGAVNKLAAFFDGAWGKMKLFTAYNTSTVHSVASLPNSITFFRTAHPTAFTADLRIENGRFFSANPTNKSESFSTHVVSSSSLSTLNYNMKVYNLEVEEDHTYIANDVVVHNCLACIELHGTELKPGERVDDHYRGRCDVFYVVPGGPQMPEIMQADSQPGQRNFVPFQKGEEWFASLPESRQKQQASFLNTPAKFRAYQSGTPLSAFVGEHQDDVFGRMVVENSLVGALGDDAEQYYQINQGKDAE